MDENEENLYNNDDNKRHVPEGGARRRIKESYTRQKEGAETNEESKDTRTRVCRPASTSPTNIQKPTISGVRRGVRGWVETPPPPPEPEKLL